jgi:pyridoxal phosphate enzyme (YggS family)
MSGLAENLARVRERMAAAAERSGRAPESVQLVAVTKGWGAEAVQGLWDLGLRDFGESRVQEALPKVATAPGDIRWHLIGPLQENKINKVLPWVFLIQSLDSLSLARALDQRARRDGLRIPVLLEVKTSPEPSKHGFPPEELAAAHGEIKSLAGLEVRGLMTIAPFTAEERARRASFRQARQQFEILQTGAPELGILSMGMSDDFETAIEEGATMVRLGSVLLGPRQ